MGTVWAIRANLSTKGVNLAIIIVVPSSIIVVCDVVDVKRLVLCNWRRHATRQITRGAILRIGTTWNLRLIHERLTRLRDGYLLIRNILWLLFLFRRCTNIRPIRLLANLRDVNLK